MKAEAWLSFAKQEIPKLAKMYGLVGWRLEILIVPEADLFMAEPHGVAASVVEEPYKRAAIVFEREHVEKSDFVDLFDLLEHEIQHVALYPLAALCELVLDQLDDRQARALGREFRRCGERLRLILDQAVHYGE